MHLVRKQLSGRIFLKRRFRIVCYTYQLPPRQSPLDLRPVSLPLLQRGLPHQADELPLDRGAEPGARLAALAQVLFSLNLMSFYLR